jgi:hypothetical protein
MINIDVLEPGDEGHKSAEVQHKAQHVGPPAGRKKVVERIDQ